MKIVKTYVLSEKGLDKDVDKFIKDARDGKYQYDYKYGMEGLKIIKQYFKFIQNAYDNNNYELAKICYKKLLFFLFETTFQYDYFQYEDIVGRSKLDFEKIITNYFSCLTKLCSTEELLGKYKEYIKAKSDFYFESADKAIMKNLNPEDLVTFENIIYNDAKKIKKEDYVMQDLIYFLLDLSKFQNNKAKYNSYCDEFSNVLSDVDELRKDY